MSSVSSIRIKLKGYDSKVLQSAIETIVDAARYTGASVIGPVPLPKQIRRVTVLRSPHTDKKSREQFEKIVYSALLIFRQVSADTIKKLEDCVLPRGVSPEVFLDKK